MSNQVENNSEHEEIQSMLPWFVNRSLDDRDREVVSSHIETCEECRDEIEFLGSINQAVLKDAHESDRMHADINKNLASVMSRIDGKEHQLDAIMSAPSSLLQKLGKMLTELVVPPVGQWGATAMAGVLVAVLGFQMFSGKSDDTYTVLSSPDIANSAIRLTVELVPGQNWDQTRSVIHSEFDKLGQQAQFESATDGAYYIVFDESIGVSELSKIVVDLESMDEIERVELLP